MWTYDGMGNAYDPKTEDMVYLNVVNVGYVEIRYCHVNLGYDELLIVQPSIQDAMDYVERFVESKNTKDDQYLLYQ